MNKKQEQKRRNALPSNLGILIDQLNAQVGFCRALVVERFTKLQRDNFLDRYAEYITLPDDSEEDDQTVGDQNLEHKTELQVGVESYNSLKNIILHIQHHIFDLKLLVCDKENAPDPSRINHQSIEWLSGFFDRIDFEDKEERILPIGDKLATNIFLARSLTMQVEVACHELGFGQEESTVMDYLSQLSLFLLKFGYWVNATTPKERIWTWQSISELEAAKEAEEQKSEQSDS